MAVFDFENLRNWARIVLYYDDILMKIQHLQFFFPLFKQLSTFNVVWNLEIPEHLQVCNFVTSANILFGESLLFELLESANICPQFTYVLLQFWFIVSFSFRGFLLAVFLS